MNLAIASGKGGTGKTTVALCLALAADGPVRLLDCDVEEPNCHLFLKPVLQQREPVTLPVPVVDASRCNGCGKCRQLCQFNAIALLRGKAVVFEELCHSCGGCAKVCPTGALTESAREIGFIELGTRNGLEFIRGSLNVGQPLAPAVIRAVKRAGCSRGAPSPRLPRTPAERRGHSTALVILDSPPGTSCAMVATVRDADHVLLVTEPTPFGLHDLKLAIATVRQLGRPLSVLINRADAGDNRVLAYCLAENIPVRLQIPEDRSVAQAYSRGEPVLDALPGLRTACEQLLSLVGRARPAIEP
jgi:MinD superfamily P-loop ATPase